MTKKALNVIICIMVLFIAFFWAGSFAYQQHLMNQSDKQEESSREDLEDGAHGSGPTLDEVK
jgi:uncharacterized protein YpmB